MMNLTKQTYLFIYCIKIGVFMGISYDVIRSMRKVIKHSSWIVEIEDFLYCLLSGILVFLMIYEKNYGEIRMYVFLGIFLGLVIYYSTVSEYIQFVFFKVIQTLFYILNFIFMPIKCIMSVLTKLINKITTD